MTQLGSLAALVLSTFLLSMAPAAAGDSPTVCEFLHLIAQARRLPAETGYEARNLLQEAGANLPVLDLSETLTERTAVSVSASLGVVLTTSRPDRAMDDRSMETLVGLLSSPGEEAEPSTRSGPYPRPNDNAADPRTKGKGKKKGLPLVSPSIP